MWSSFDRLRGPGPLDSRSVSTGQRLFQILASLKLAVAVMLLLAAACALGSAYEVAHGTAAAQRDVYRTWWFGLLLSALAANVLCAMTARYPWKRQHVGFVLAHVGILVLLGGSLVSLHWGLDARLELLEGATADRVALLERALQVTLPHAAPASFGADIEARPPAPGRERRFKIPGTQAALVADGFHPHVEVAEEGARGQGLHPAPLPAAEERRRPAVRLRIEGPEGDSEPAWLAWGASRPVAYAGARAVLAYRAPEAPLPFRVTLLEFRVRTYPGTRTPAAFDSHLRVDDPVAGVSQHRVAMNRPLHHRGYVFFQSAFVEGAPMTAIFSVARAPGLPLVYAGGGLICLGVAWMFYVKPRLVRRARAEAVRVGQETLHDPQSDPAGPRAGPVQPARSQL